MFLVKTDYLFQISIPTFQINTCVSFGKRDFYLSDNHFDSNLKQIWRQFQLRHVSGSNLAYAYDINTHTKRKKNKQEHNDATKNRFITIVDRLRTVGWSA